MFTACTGCGGLLRGAPTERDTATPPEAAAAATAAAPTTTPRALKSGMSLFGALTSPTSHHRQPQRTYFPQSSFTFGSGVRYSSVKENSEATTQNNNNNGELDSKASQTSAEEEEEGSVHFRRSSLGGAAAARRNSQLARLSLTQRLEPAISEGEEPVPLQTSSRLAGETMGEEEKCVI